MKLNFIFHCLPIEVLSDYSKSPAIQIILSPPLFELSPLLHFTSINFKFICIGKGSTVRAIFSRTKLFYTSFIIFIEFYFHLMRNAALKSCQKGDIYKYIEIV